VREEEEEEEEKKKTVNQTHCVAHSTYKYTLVTISPKIYPGNLPSNRDLHYFF
jgi:hypothetical protein